eukprot:3181562-Rhodomonas_salina.2
MSGADRAWRDQTWHVDVNTFGSTSSLQPSACSSGTRHTNDSVQAGQPRFTVPMSFPDGNRISTVFVQ